jgi:hypothetical protein
VDDVPRWRPGVTLLQPPAMFLLLVSVSGIVTNGICRPYIVKGADFLSSLFQWAPGLLDSRGETGCLCGFIVVRMKFSEEPSNVGGKCRKARRGSKPPGDHNVAVSQSRLTLSAGGFQSIRNDFVRFCNCVLTLRGVHTGFPKIDQKRTPSCRTRTLRV